MVVYIIAGYPTCHMAVIAVICSQRRGNSVSNACYEMQFPGTIEISLLVQTRVSTNLPGPTSDHGLTLIPAWISNHILSKEWREITCTFPNFNGCTADVWKLRNNFILQTVWVKRSHVINTIWKQFFWNYDSPFNHYSPSCRDYYVAKRPYLNVYTTIPPIMYNRHLYARLGTMIASCQLSDCSFAPSICSWQLMLNIQYWVRHVFLYHIAPYSTVAVDLNI